MITVSGKALDSRLPPVAPLDLSVGVLWRPETTSEEYMLKNAILESAYPANAF